MSDLAEMLASAKTHGYAECIDDCAKIISEIPTLCDSCPIDCHLWTGTSCEEEWKNYLKEQLKEKNNGI